MKLTNQEIVDWADGYIKAQEKYNEISVRCRLHWAVQKFFQYEIEHPEVCWEAILQIHRRKPSEKVLEILAEGPLKDLIENHGTEFIERIETEAKANSEFKKLLHGVKGSSREEVWKRILKARK